METSLPIDISVGCRRLSKIFPYQEALTTELSPFFERKNFAGDVELVLKPSAGKLFAPLCTLKEIKIVCDQ